MTSLEEMRWMKLFHSWLRDLAESVLIVIHCVMFLSFIFLFFIVYHCVRCHNK